MRLRVILAALLALAAVGTAQAEKMTVAISTPEIQINSNFTGTNVTIFGVIERDAGTIARNAPYEVATLVLGPPETVVARRKDRFLGIWLNGASETIVSPPIFYSLATTPGLGAPQLAAPAFRNLELGFENIAFTYADRLETNDPGASEFREAFLRLKGESNLYAENLGGVSFIGDSVFRATVRIPANVPVGRYRVLVYLFAGEALLAQSEESIKVSKIGFEQYMFEAAHSRAALYGLGCVALALFTGWIAGVVFRRD
ncbi:MAG: TIGR02186 family protein [Rhizobiales bacterium]|nr:TIGR02186 family protein [Hyphomicrobiales bacterium]